MSSQVNEFFSPSQVNQFLPSHLDEYFKTKNLKTCLFQCLQPYLPMFFLESKLRANLTLTHWTTIYMFFCSTVK